MDRCPDRNLICAFWKYEWKDKAEGGYKWEKSNFGDHIGF